MDNLKIGRVTFGTVAKTIPIARRPDTDPQMDEDMRRLCLSMLALLKRRYPKDWRRVALELFDAKAA